MPFDVPRVRLAQLPTPIQELPRLSRCLGGPRILVKRDDLTGLAGGGNKARKLEYLMADALRQDAQTVITAGAAQSNHARQTAAAAARCGLGAVLVLSPMAPAECNGNLLLDRLLGARIRWTGDRDAYSVMQEVAEEERSAERRPYLIPYGGSNAIGATAYVVAMHELVDQAKAQDLVIHRIVFASSSGGTQAGLAVGALSAGFEGIVEGISVARPRDELARTVANLAQLTAAFLGLSVRVDPTDLTIVDDYLGGGYGVMSAVERDAIRMVAECEGLLLDPVYTGRAMAGLIDRIGKGIYSPEETILFWHTGGTPALYAYAREMLSTSEQ